MWFLYIYFNIKIKLIDKNGKQKQITNGFENTEEIIHAYVGTKLNHVEIDA